MYVQGTGMMPLVRPGDVALIRRDKLENMRSGDVVLFQRGNHLLAKRLGEEDLPADEAASEGGDVRRGEPEEFLGQIMRVQRQSEEIDLTSKETALDAVVSMVLRPAKWAKETLRASDETST